MSILDLDAANAAFGHMTMAELTAFEGSSFQRLQACLVLRARRKKDLPLHPDDPLIPLHEQRRELSPPKGKPPKSKEKPPQQAIKVIHKDTDELARLNAKIEALQELAESDSMTEVRVRSLAAENDRVRKRIKVLETLIRSQGWELPA